MHEFDGDDTLLEGGHDEVHLLHGLVELLLVSDYVAHLLPGDVRSLLFNHGDWSEEDPWHGYTTSCYTRNMEVAVAD